ncbi:MAG: hypothetical protein NZ699_08825 [Roseiflexus sp.]|nr:hypothetical protein [Roseiflexus sp.]MCS7289220.1 hypothetical protein [Roseiflexus sp.]MDW8146719.1 hypothetical protein [Roseiflexaceae bacterium]MDW8232634.1 hypothetical protein [Roseiflexaceae bacterium]
MLLLTGSLILALAACSAPTATQSDTPVLPTGEPSPPSVTPLPTGEPGQIPEVEPSASPAAGTPTAPSVVADIMPTTAATLAPSPAPQSAAPTAPMLTLPSPPPQVTALALPVPEVQPPVNVVERAILPADLLARLVSDLAGRSGSDPSTITLISAEAVIWNDGSLGCPQPGMVYPQVQIEGYRVVLRVGDRNYDYRVGKGGSFVLCDRPIRRP